MTTPTPEQVLAGFLMMLKVPRKFPFADGERNVVILSEEMAADMADAITALREQLAESERKSREWKCEAMVRRQTQAELEAAIATMREQRDINFDAVDGDELKADNAALLIERDNALARLDRSVKILVGIHELLYPQPVKHEDGRTFVFHSPLVHEQMQQLSDRIRAIPDEIAANDAAMREGKEKP